MTAGAKRPGRTALIWVLIVASAAPILMARVAPALKFPLVVLAGLFVLAAVVLIFTAPGDAE